MASSNKRFLERFWSFYLVGRLGARHTLGHALLGFLRLLGLAMVVLSTLAILMLVVPDLVAVLMALAVMVGLLVMLVKMAWRLVTWMFR